MWDAFASAAREAIRQFDDVDPDHPVWSDRPYVVFLYTPDQVRQRIKYVSDNPLEAGLPAQSWPWVRPYDGWPHPRRR